MGRSKDPEWFNDDINFAHVMQQALYLQRGIVHELAKFNRDSAELNQIMACDRPVPRALLAGWVCSRSGIASQTEQAVSCRSVGTPS